MEAHPVRICVSVTFLNIRFDSKGVVPRQHHTYVTADPFLEPTFSGCVRYSVYGRSFHWCLDGSVVASISEPVHSPRCDNIHHGERGQIYLRGWVGPPGVGAVHERTDPTPDPARSRTGARRSLYGRQLRGRGRLDRGCARNTARPARNAATLGQAAMVAALFRPARRAVQLARPGEK